MRFFYLDYHISVIADLKDIFGRLGHQVDGISLSGHAHITKELRRECKLPIREQFPSIFKNDFPNLFYREYHKELDKYDGFICTYPPAMCLLYQRWDKPTILHIPIRYEYPFTMDNGAWQAFNRFLKERAKAGLLIPVANNLYDQKYYNVFVGPEEEKQACRHIPSWCGGYTGMKYRGRHKHWLYSALKDIQPLQNQAWLLWKDRAFKSGSGYSWQKIADYRGVVHFPYNVSTMSFFEQYAANIPLVVPSKTLLLQMSQWNTGGVLSQYSWGRTWHHGPKDGGIRLPFRDPNNWNDWETMEDWMELCDWYNLPHVTTFNSVEELNHLLPKLKTKEISESMVLHNKNREAKIVEEWSKVLEGL